MDDEPQLDKMEKQIEAPLRYPRSVFFIIVNELCERFSFMSMRAVLVLFLKDELRLSEDDATIVFHTFNMTCYAFPIVGGIVADSWLGKFRTILYLSLVYALGNIVLSLSAWTSLGLPGFPLTCVGLLLIAAGTGGIKPCVCSFGGDQFLLPQQRRQLEAFFRLFYFAVNVGVTLAGLVTPLLRTTPCLGHDTCFPAAFGLPAALMVFFCGVFVAGRPMYIMKKPEGNVLVQVCKCISRGLWRRVRHGRSTGSHWLDSAGPDSLVADIKVLLSLLVLALPLPVFWALFDMIGSRWTFQAVQLNGDLGGGVTLRPDQMQLALGLWVMTLIAVFEVAVNPLLARARLLDTPLQRMTVGGLMAAVSFLCAAVLQIYVDRLEEVGGQAHVLWQIPQYFFMALGEVWFAIGVLEFGYKEAPLSMKSTIQAVFLLTTSIGDTIVIIVTSASLFASRTTEFFVYAGLMAAVMAVFMVLASRYTYVGQPCTPAKQRASFGAKRQVKGSDSAMTVES
ncbi:solute carrier family 15 member 2-like [Thrips palmi]|uniref:Solute carrier family 15 member 2-like n=1 Tax=Thrips palmi TaxID=161013 RepID=A0A6P8ZPE7_THRPL|nr:solute carrier family 15 member 2-like [Thrips palmi]